jgi:hypothetical protein
MLKLNLGCGTNKLPGWENHDADLDITKRLPFSDSSVSFIFIEHCVEHVDYYQAVEFFRECLRVLAVGGVLRVTVPSVEQVRRSTDDDYFKLAAKWGKTPDLRGALDAIINCHGHRTCWTASLMAATLKFVGFDAAQCEVHNSQHPDLQNVEGHHRVIGEKFNAIESMVFEGTRIGQASRVTVVVGGAEGVWAEVEEARALCAAAGAQPEFIVVNDMIATFPGECVVASLHPDKIPAWLSLRRSGHHPDPKEVWAHNRRANHPFITHTTKDWGGSSGLFAAKVAIERGASHVLLCGVPMEVARNHFVRKTRWVACQAFWRAWGTHKADLGRVRSLSGATGDLLGRPGVDFLGLGMPGVGLNEGPATLGAILPAGQPLAIATGQGDAV